MNWDFITGRLATGGGPVTTADIANLVAAGVTHIIDCREQDDSALFGPYASTIIYLWNPTADDGAQKSDFWFARSLDFGLPVMLDDRTSPSYVIYSHCDMGINRGPSTAALLLMAAYKMALNDVRELIIRHRLIDAAGLRYAEQAADFLKRNGRGWFSND